MGDLAILIIEYAARTVVLTLLLWAMVKLQKLDYFFLGLLGSAALACALDTIPYFGHYLAVPVLYFCIWKVTHASLMPDAVFTVVVAYALMFAVKVLLFTALIGDLRMSTSSDENDPVPPAVAAAKPAPSVPAPVPVPVPATNQHAASPVKTPSKSAEEILKEITFKGLTQNGDKSMLVVNANKKNYTLMTGETTVVQTASGTCRIRLVAMSANWATLEVNGEETVWRIH